MNIKVLGTGCMNCRTLTERTQQVVNQLRLPANVEKVEDYRAIAAYGVMKTPGLVVDGVVVHSGSVPTVEKLTELLQAVKPKQ